MAKWGEGDPRWIVEERPDAINVNNWHWTEKNACGWSKAKIKELFTGFKIENALFKCKIVDVDSCTGEAVANNRKGKLIFFYEWVIKLNWKGKLASAEDYVKGKITIPNLSEENEVNEIDVNITTNESTTDGDLLRVTMNDLVTEKVRELLDKYITGLKAEFSQGMILPSKGSNEDNECKSTMSNSASRLDTKVQMNSNVVGTAKSAPDIKVSENEIKTTTLEIQQVFQCTGLELYNALTIAEFATAFTRGPVSIDLKVGGTFEFFGGNVSGKFIELLPHSKIIQTWRYKKWPSDHFSIVTIDLIQQSDHTELKLLQTGIPEEELDNIREKWERYYLDAIKITFGFGCFL